MPTRTANPQAHFGYFMDELGLRGLAYVHVLEGDMISKVSVLDYRALRAQLASPYIANNGYDLARAQAALHSGAADPVAFGAPFLANPDLMRRYRDGLPLNAADPATFYVGGKLVTSTTRSIAASTSRHSHAVLLLAGEVTS